MGNQLQGPPPPGYVRGPDGNYNYETGGLSYSQRVPQNLLGPEAKAVRNQVDTVNDRLMLGKLHDATGSMEMSMGPQG